MKYDIERTSRFKKDYKASINRGLDPAPLMHVISLLADGQVLPLQHRDHNLGGNYSGYRECHVLPDWLLIYKKTESLLILTLYRTGTHSDLF